jgi:hypothetical protein
LLADIWVVFSADALVTAVLRFAAPATGAFALTFDVVALLDDAFFVVVFLTVDFLLTAFFFGGAFVAFTGLFLVVLLVVLDMYYFSLDREIPGMPRG